MRYLLAILCLLYPCQSFAAVGDIVRIDQYFYEVGDPYATDCDVENHGGFSCLYVAPDANGVYAFDAMLPAKDCVNDVDDGAKLEKLLGKTVVPAPSPGWYPTAGQIELGYGCAHIGQEIQVKQYTILQGKNSGLASANATTLEFPADVPCLTVNRYNTLDGGTQNTPTTGADGSIIRGIHFDGDADRCILERGRAVLEDLSFKGFDTDVKVVATAGAGGALEGNANRWYMNRVKGSLLVDGADANAGISIAHDAPGGADYGIEDTSFLGNTYISPHTAANGAGYKFDNDSARHVILGGYAEGNQGGTIIHGPSLALGGIYGSFAQGGTITGIDGNGLKNMRSVETDQGDMSILFGGGNGYIFKACHDNDSSGNCLGLKREGNDWWITHAGIGARIACRITGEHTTEDAGTGTPQPYKLWCKEIIIGNGNAATLFGPEDIGN